MGLPPVRPLDEVHSPAEIAREEGRRERGMLRDVIDAHTHLFPDSFYRALERWFDQHAWSIAFRGNAESVLEELKRIGVSQTIALVYSHKPGVARYLNQYLADLCRSAPQVVGVGTVLPGEPDAPLIVREAVTKHGLRGIKLHCHVQRMPIDDPRVVEALLECEKLGVPAVVHCGREPSTTAYGIDPRAICHVDRAEHVLQKLPNLKLVVPHLGMDEFAEYLALLSRYENLYLDTSVACAEYFPMRPCVELLEPWAHRVMYGSDFPLVPYEPDRELRALARRVVSDNALEQMLRGTAKTFWGLIQSYP